MNINRLNWKDKQKQTFHNLPKKSFTGRIDKIEKPEKWIILSVQYINI